MSLTLVQIIVTSVIGTGIFAVLGYLVRGQSGMREDVREIKSVLGINGHPAIGIVPRVKELGERSHDHGNKLAVLMAERELRQSS